MPATDDFVGHAVGLSSPATHAAAVTPSDTVDLTDVSRYLWVGAAGDVTVITLGGETALFKAVPAGTLIPIRATRVKATGTASTSITAMW